LTILVAYMVVSGGFRRRHPRRQGLQQLSLMNGHVLPPESFIIEPWYLNFFNNMALVQFDHRLGAWLLAFWCHGSGGRSGGGRFRRHAWPPRCCGGAVHPDRCSASPRCCWLVPVGLGAAHQGGAMVVLGVLLWLNHELRVARLPGDSA
jgi:cytochrome c oxidase assembly protein subunit 15